MSFWNVPRADMGNPNWIKGRIQQNFEKFVVFSKNLQVLRLLKNVIKELRWPQVAHGCPRVPTNKLALKKHQVMLHKK
jgi:hypothetical protein